MGAKLRSRLPEGCGLTAELAEELADNPRQIVGIVLLDVDDVVMHVANGGSTTTVLELLALETFDGLDADNLRSLLTKRQETRTGETSLFGDDEAIPGSSTGDPEELTRQLGLLRAEEAAKLREKAEAEDDLDAARHLESEADSFESGGRDEELRARLQPQFLTAEDSDA